MTAVSIEQPHRFLPAQPTASGWPIPKIFLWSVPMLVVFLNGADFHGANPDGSFRIHWQILLRLAISGLCGLVGAFYLFPYTYRDFLTWPGFLVSAMIAVCGLSQIFSLAPSYSLVAWICYVCVALTVPVAMRFLGATAYLSSILAGSVAFIIGSWIAYLFFPEIGVFQEFVSKTEFVERMGGLGHPNILGIVCALTIVITAGMATTRTIRWDLAAAIALFAGVTLITCYSRTSMICCLVGLTVTFRKDLLKAGNLAFLGVFAMFAVLGLFLLVGSGNLDWYLKDLARGVSKSGDINELTTATGRTEIWSRALEFIASSPFGGYGYATQRFYMDDYSFHAHNMILNATLSAGIGGGLITLAMTLVILGGVLFKPRPLIDGLAVCMICAASIDGVIPQPSPSGPDMAWLSLIFWRQIFKE